MKRQLASIFTVMFSIIATALPTVAQEVEPQRAGRQSADVANQTIPVPPVPIEIKVQFESRNCNSEVNITYEQRNTIARVESTIGSSSCPASRGEYTLVVGFRDESNESGSLEFAETWQRSDDEPLSFVKDYEIGENVDLTRIRLRNLRCTCTDLPAE